MRASLRRMSRVATLIAATHAGCWLGLSQAADQSVYMWFLCAMDFSLLGSWIPRGTVQREDVQEAKGEAAIHPHSSLVGEVCIAHISHHILATYYFNLL